MLSLTGLIKSSSSFLPERKRQFDLKRKKHYDEFRAAHFADNDDDEPKQTTG